MKVVIVGAGSVGYGHLRYAVGRYGECGVVDPNPQKLVEAEKEFPGKVKCFPNLQALFRDGSLKSDPLFVVSNLGPDHMQTVLTLVSHQVKKIYLEKPMAVSIADCQELVKLSNDGGVSILVGFQRRQSGLAEVVRSLAVEHGTTLPTSMVVHGGALDVSTNGIHWLDFAADLFESRPQSVIGSGSKDKINPRHEGLYFWDGSLTWSFPGNRRLTVSFDNKSSVAPTVLVYSRNATVDLSSGLPIVKTRNPRDVLTFPAVTRYGAASEEVTSITEIASLVDGREKIFDLLEGDENLTPFLDESAAVTSALWAGLWALENEELIRLPVESTHPCFSISWSAS